MRKVNFGLATMVSLCAALVQASGLAQEFQTSFKPRVLYERDVVQAPRGISPEYKDSYFTKSNRAILTRLGTELLVNDPANSQILVVDTKTFAETRVTLDSPATEVQTDIQTDRLFVSLWDPKRTVGDAIPTCYATLNEFRNQQSSWSLPRSSPKLQFLWLNEHQQFVAYSFHHPKHLVLLDPNGVKLAEYDFEEHTLVVGVDETEEGFNIFHLIKNRNTRQLALTQLNDKFTELRTRKWPLLDRFQNVGISPLGISRSFRLRGLKSGEVTKYFLDEARQPRFIEANGRLPVENFKSKWFGYANKLSSAESPLQPEIIVGFSDSTFGFGDEFILFDQQSNYYHVPDQCLTDAFFDEKRKMIVTVANTNKRGTWKVRLISFE